MISPISSAGQGPTGATPMHEAVLRFGATQEVREQKRSEQVTVDEKSSTPVDEAFIDITSLADAQDGQQAPPQGASAEHKTHQGGHAANNDAAGQARTHEREQQQEAGLSQYAGEQQGKKEVQRQDVHRSTREMMGRLDGIRSVADVGDAQAASTPCNSQPEEGAKHGPESASTSTDKVPADAGSADNSAPTTFAAPSPNGSSSGMAPRIDGHVLAAAVGSGATTGHGPMSAHGAEKENLLAEDIDSSDESRRMRQEDQGKKAGRQRSLENSFGDGAGGDEQRHRQPDHQGMRGGMGNGADGNSQREPQRVQPQTEAAGDRVEGAPSTVASGSVAERVTTTSQATTADARETTAVEATTATHGATQTARDEAATTAHDAARPAQTAVTAHQSQPPSAGDSVGHGQPNAAGAESYQPTSHFSPGLGSLMGDEYFFFDDARFAPEPPAAAS